LIIYGEEKVLQSKGLIKHDRIRLTVCTQAPTQFSRLHLVVYFGFKLYNNGLARKRRRCGPQGYFVVGRHSHGAAENGHEAVVKLLFAKGNAKPNLKDNDSRMSLYWAAVSGHEEVVKLLLAKDSVDLRQKG
jgi:hypothetical protein